MQPELILVVEDEDAIRANIARLLRIEGFEVVAAANGKEALAYATERLPALVLSDVTMPEMDGHGLLAALRALPATADIPFVFLTARADHSDMREGMEHGLQKIEVFLKGPGSGRETAMRSLQAAGLEIIGVRDVSPQAHNGCRARKRRRV